MANPMEAPYGRIASIFDEGSFVEIGALITGRNNLKAGNDWSDGDGVVTGYGTIDGCLAFVYAQDARAEGGSVGEMHAKKISKIYDMAVEMGAPVLALLDCAGVRLSEGNDSLFSFGRIFKHQAAASGVVPQITVVYGSCGGGLAVSAAMSDFVFMEKENGRLFLNSPNAVTGNYIEKCDTSGADFQTAETGLCDFAGTADEVNSAVRTLISMLPQNNEEDLSAVECDDDLNRSASGIEKAAKEDQIAMIADNGTFFELKKDHASCVLTGFIRINGRTVGVVADKGGIICHAGCNKAARFVNFCDGFNIPLLTLTDVEGFARDRENEVNLARALGKLTYAYSRATVPTVTVVTGAAYGTAGVAMNSKAIGADMVYAWKDARMGLMDEKQLNGLIPADAQDAGVNSALYNARRGYIDGIIAPEETRQRVAAAFEMLYSKSIAVFQGKHGTV